jgi:acyl-CoA thioesterase-1
VLFAVLSFCLLCPSSFAAAPARILCLGDSLTEGLGVGPKQAWPSLLEQALHDKGFKDAVVINAGVSGATSASGPGRLKWALKGPVKPTIMILELGANDGLRGQDVAAMKKNLQASIALAKAAGVTVLLAGMKVPLSLGRDYVTRFDQAFPEIAAAEHVALLPFLLEGVAAHLKLNQADGIHPTAEGHKILAATVLNSLLPLLSK